MVVEGRAVLGSDVSRADRMPVILLYWGVRRRSSAVASRRRQFSVLAAGWEEECEGARVRGCEGDGG